MDSASRQMGAGLGLQFKAPIGEIIEQTICLDFFASNNEAEYEAIIVGIDLAMKRLSIGGRDVNGEYETKD